MKQFNPPDIVYKSVQSTLKQGITPIASLSVKTILLQSPKKPIIKVSGFYQRHVDNFLKWSESVFTDYAKKDYDADTNPRKKYRYTPFLLSYDTKHEFINDHILKITIEIILSKNKSIISKKEIPHCWNLLSGTVFFTPQK